jgi:Alpha-L-arabinofuranosidase B, catalytic/Concanavalin A-like lectin/glucanases superfamily/NPCBM-associated, NEW3 domain of alpha-galactosidase/Lamin Tail Domain
MFRSPVRRIRLKTLAAGLAIALVPIGVTFATATVAHAADPVAPPRPQGPCDIYAAAGTPCVAAHSTTRALSASYNGPLYQVMRLSDKRVKDVGVVAPRALPFPDAGGYADAAAQDAFCANTTCLITKVYDQSPMHNDLTQAPRGAFSGPAMGGFNNLPIADMAPVTLSGHKAYGVFIEPGMGLRNNDTRGIAVDDQPEGMYWVLDGQHFNDGCCYDYGNAEIDSRDDGNGTMETSYYGNATAWYHGPPPGPWIMTDQENNLVGCVNPGSTSKLCADLPSITSRFVTAVAKGEPHHWASLGGDAQQGALSTMFDGPRVDSSYDPMRKQGAIVLGNGGDNSNASQGTFYEGVMTAGYPSDSVDQQVQANVVAAKYDVQRLRLSPASASTTPPGLQTFVPGSSQDVTETFTNTTGSTAVNVKLSLSLPDKQWTSFVSGTTDTSITFDSVAPGASVNATFRVTSGPAAFNGDLVGNAAWTNPTNSARRSETTTEKVRNVGPIKINEFRSGTSSNSTNSFIELYNASASAVDISNWTLTEHPTQQAVFSTVTVPAGTTLASHGHYLLGLANSGLAAPASAGDSTVSVRSTSGMAPGQQVQIGTDSAAETRTITHITNSGATGPRVPGEIGNAVKLNGSGEYVNLPSGIVSSLSDFTVSAWVNPAANSAWSRVFDFGTGTGNYMFLTLSAGGGPLRFAITTGGNGVEQQINGPGTLPLNTWSHVAVTLSGTTGTLYVNGQPVGTNNNMTLHPSNLGNTNQNWIGRSQFSADPFLAATVDDFQIYSHALSPTEIAALAGGQPGAGDVASYKFDEDSGETALDSSGNGRNATIVSAPSVSTPLWQPLPDGPVITIPAGSTNVPVTSTSGFTVGQKMAIGYGDTFEQATVTAIGRPGTQARLSAPAATGATNIKVTSTANITAGDTIRLDIGSKIETVTVAAVGTSGAGGTGLTLAAPLRFNHSSNLPFSDRGTGISFAPATRFPHSSNEPVQALGSGITLDSPLAQAHAINTPVRDAVVTNAGYQGTPAPDQWFGGPVLSSSAGNMVLRDAGGRVADSLNYGSLVDPWTAEGYQGASGAGRNGCQVPNPSAGRSAIRFPDGTDTDSNCTDFVTTGSPTPGAANTIPTATRSPGQPGFGNAVPLNGSAPNQYVNLPQGIVSNLTDFSIAAWVNPGTTSGQTWARIFDFGSGTSDFMFLTVNAGGAGLRFDINSQGGTSQMIGGTGLQLPTGWQHVAVTLSGNTGTLWVNGMPVATNTNMTQRPADLGNTNQNWIGRSQFSADPLLSAAVDEFQIYNRALSQAEIQSLMTSPGGTTGGGNVAWYRFDEDGGALAVDSSGNGNDATVVTSF